MYFFPVFLFRYTLMPKSNIEIAEIVYFLCIRLYFNQAYIVEQQGKKVSLKYMKVLNDSE